LKVTSEKSMSLDETYIYKKIETWDAFSEEEKEGGAEYKIGSKGEYNVERAKFCRKKDFLRTFIILCQIASRTIYPDMQMKEFVGNAIGTVLGDLIWETENIEDLRKIVAHLSLNHEKEFLEWIDDRKKGRVWILETKISTLIDNAIDSNVMKKHIKRIPPDWKMTFEDFTRYEFGLYSDISFTEVEAVLARGISYNYLCNILYGFIIFRILMSAYENNLYINLFGDEKLLRGHSGINHFFDGILVLSESDRAKPWLLKCVCKYNNPLDAIESVDSKMDDIGAKRSIMFVPMYPSQKALQYSVYTRSEKQYEIAILYLIDIYRLIWTEDARGYLIEKAIY
jgi:hypothetical protein